MPMTRARRLCSQLLVVPPDHREYQDVSSQVFEIFRSFTPLVEGLSLDEAFLDVSGLRRHFPDAVAVGTALRAVIRQGLGLPASVGVASNKFLAKLASEVAKPDGLKLVPSTETTSFLNDLPVDALSGVGQATLAALAKMGVETVGDLAAVPGSVLAAKLGRSLGQHLADLAAGRDERPVVPDTGAKSISVEETYGLDLASYAEVEIELLRLCVRLAGRMQRSSVVGHTVNLKVRLPDFTTVNRSFTSSESLADEHTLYGIAKDLFTRSGAVGRPIRLLGVGMSKLEPKDEPSQLDLGGNPRWMQLGSVLESVRERYGPEAVGPASLKTGRSHKRTGNVY